MRRRTVLTDSKLAALKPRPQRYDVADAITPALIVRVTPTGHKALMFRKRMPGCKNPTRRKIATVGEIELEDAREVARDWHGLLRRGIDPAHEARRLRQEARSAVLFAQAAEDYIERRVSDLRRNHDVARDIRRGLIARWGELPLREVTRESIVEFIEEVGAHTPSRAHVLFWHLRAIFNWLRERGMVEHSPCDRIRPARLIGPLQPRQRVLSDTELRAFWSAAGKLPFPHGPLHKLVLLTGGRLREIADASWSEFDLSERLWRIAPHRYKSNAHHVVPLSADAAALLEGLPRHKKSDFVFTTNGRAPVRSFSLPKAKIDELMAKALGAPPEPWVVHDLRRTVRTRLSALRVPSEVAERVLGHGPRGLERVYDQHAYLDEMRDALDAWAARVQEIVDESAK